MARVRNIYQVELAYVGPTGANAATGKHGGTAVFNGYPKSQAEIASGGNLIAELYRVQRAGWNANKNLTDVNQFGELAAIDRIPLNPPTVQLNIDYILSNLVNEQLMGLTISKEGDTQDVSMVSGIIAGTYNPKNYFLKVVSEGADAIDNSATNYNVIAVGNGFMSSYTSQGAVGGFPTASVTIDALNIQSDAITATTGALIPAVNPTDGTRITGYLYVLPTGLTSINNAPLTANLGISALRPGDITLDLGIGAGDSFYVPSDLKIQSYNLSFNLNQEDLNKLGSKYAFAKVPVFPVTSTLQVETFAGDLQTGNLIDIVSDNRSFNPSITIKHPTNSNQVIAKYTLKNAKLDTQASDLNIGSNRSLSLTFNAQIGGPESVTAGLFASGITV